MIGRIREVLGFQTEGATMAVDAPFSLDGIAQEVAAIKLYTRLLGPHFQHPARCRLAHRGRQLQRALCLFGENEIMVVAETVANLLVVGIDARANGVRRLEVERRALDRKSVV